MQVLRIGTRKSKLALTQATIVKELLFKHCNIQGELVGIQTTGDTKASSNLAEIGGKGLFTKELEEALRRGEIDIAVHSLKDMPAILHDDFMLASYLKRGDPRDILIANEEAHNINELKPGAIIGTSSPRRKEQLLKIRPDLNIVPLRGNVNTRLAKLDSKQIDATILAKAGLDRLMIDRGFAISQAQMLPAACQAIIAIEILTTSPYRSIIENLNDNITEICALAERSFLAAYNASCTTAIAVYAEVIEDMLHIEAESFVNIYLRTKLKTNMLTKEGAIDIGIKLAQELIGNNS